MKKYMLSSLFIIFFHTFSITQNSYSIGIKLVAERNWIIGTGFDNINRILDNNKIIALANIHNTNGFIFSILGKDKRYGFEIGALGMRANYFKRPIDDKDLVSPIITSQNLRIAFIAKLYEKNRLRLVGGGGIESDKMVVKLLDLRPQTNSLNALVGNAALSPSLSYSRDPNTKIQAFAEGDYLTKLIDKDRGELVIGLRIAYTYQISRSEDRMRWYIEETRNQIEGFPTVIADNLSIQLNVAIRFNLASTTKQ